MWLDKPLGGIVHFSLLLGTQACYWIWYFGAIIFSRKAKYKKLILISNLVLTSISAILSCFGIIALLANQPFHVWFTFVCGPTCGVICFVPMYFVIKHNYKQAELKKMNIDDLT